MHPKHAALPKHTKCSREQCKANTLPILMHQMRISTTKVSSVVLRPEKSWNSENSGKEPKIPNTVP
jgi:hypothetical protein